MTGQLFEVSRSLSVASISCLYLQATFVLTALSQRKSHVAQMRKYLSVSKGLICAYISVLFDTRPSQCYVTRVNKPVKTSGCLVLVKYSHDTQSFPFLFLLSSTDAQQWGTWFDVRTRRGPLAGTSPTLMNVPTFTGVVSIFIFYVKNACLVREVFLVCARSSVSQQGTEISVVMC